MGFASLLAGQQRQGIVFLIGTPEESAALFGTPAPKIPHGDVDASGVERIAIATGIGLREAFARWLDGIARGLVEGQAIMPGPENRSSISSETSRLCASQNRFAKPCLRSATAIVRSVC